MTKNTKSNKKSNAKKLVPAVGMLAVSAVMLSTSTYAWFTMNKDVAVTGLAMKATTGDSLEICMASIGNDMSAVASKKPDNTTYGTWDDLSWRRSVDIDEYYKFIAKLKPASSNSANPVYVIDDTGVYAAGKNVKNETIVKKASAMGNGSLVVDDVYSTPNLTSDVAAGQTEVSDFYIDIPFWLRTSDSTEGGRTINAWVEITDGKDGVTSDLKNAVRVAFIPISSTSNLKTTSSCGTYSQTASYTIDSNVKNAATIFGINSDTYRSKVLGNGNDADATTNPLSTSIYTYDTYKFGNEVTDVTKSSLVDAIAANTTTDFTTITDWSAATNGVSIGKMPAAATDDYSCVQYVCRIWLEGESTSCNDATANQDWNIQMHFQLAPVTAPAGGGGGTGGSGE